jgi:hypothetical protein
MLLLPLLPLIALERVLRSISNSLVSKMVSNAVSYTIPYHKILIQTTHSHFFLFSLRKRVIE